LVVQLLADFILSLCRLFTERLASILCRNAPLVTLLRKHRRDRHLNEDANSILLKGL